MYGYMTNTETDYRTPHELVTGEKPDVSKMVAFYSPGVYHVTKDESESSLEVLVGSKRTSLGRQWSITKTS
jgi:hypothetical protein